MKRSKPVVSVRVEPEQKRALDALAERNKKTITELLTAVVDHLLKEETAGFLQNRPDPLAGEITQGMTKITMRYPTLLREAAEFEAGLKGMKISPWIASLMQSHLLNIPVHSNEELNALRAGNRELQSIGRNLNQMAHALNVALKMNGAVNTDAAKLELIHSIKDSIDEHTALIHGLIRASLKSWGVRNESQ